MARPVLRRLPVAADTHAATWEDGWGDAPATYGRIMLLGSPDLRTWTPSVILDSECDDRDPKLLPTSEGIIYDVTQLSILSRNP